MVFASGFSCGVEGCDNQPIARGLCRKHYQRWYRTGSVQPLERARRCVMCGGWFVIQRKNTLFCSRECRLEFKKRERKGCAPRLVPTPIRDDRPPIKQPEELRVVKQGFSLEQVWDRFDGTCRLCGEPVDRSVDPWLPEAGVPDWIVPVDAGGEFCLENRTIVHRSCLSRKGSGAGNARKGRKKASSHGGKR